MGMGMGGNGKADLGKNGNGNDAMGVGGSGNLKTHSRTPLLQTTGKGWRKVPRGIAGMLMRRD